MLYFRKIAIEQKQKFHEKFPQRFCKDIPLFSLHHSKKKFKCLTTDKKCEAVIGVSVKQMRMIRYEIKSFFRGMFVQAARAVQFSQHVKQTFYTNTAANKMANEMNGT